MPCKHILKLKEFLGEYNLEGLFFAKRWQKIINEENLD